VDPLDHRVDGRHTHAPRAHDSRVVAYAAQNARILLGTPVPVGQLSRYRLDQGALGDAGAQRCR
jgi:hypothetical protein